MIFQAALAGSLMVSAITLTRVNCSFCWTLNWYLSRQLYPPDLEVSSANVEIKI